MHSRASRQPLPWALGSREWTAQLPVLAHFRFHHSEQGVGPALKMVGYSTVNCTVSQQYSRQHEVVLCALWSVS